MAKAKDISPRKDFSPIRLQIHNPGKRLRLVQLFRTIPVAGPDPQTGFKLLHPDMHYGVLCSMLERVMLVITRTQLQVVKGDADAYHQEVMQLESLGRPQTLIRFDNIPRYSEERLQISDNSFRIGPDRRLFVKVHGGTAIELCFFVSTGIVPTGKGRPVMEEQE